MEEVRVDVDDVVKDEHEGADDGSGLASYVSLAQPVDMNLFVRVKQDLELIEEQSEYYVCNLHPEGDHCKDVLPFWFKVMVQVGESALRAVQFVTELDSHSQSFLNSPCSYTKVVFHRRAAGDDGNLFRATLSPPLDRELAFRAAASFPRDYAGGIVSEANLSDVVFPNPIPKYVLKIVEKQTLSSQFQKSNTFIVPAPEYSKALETCLKRSLGLQHTMLKKRHKFFLAAEIDPIEWRYNACLTVLKKAVLDPEERLRWTTAYHNILAKHPRLSLHLDLIRNVRNDGNEEPRRQLSDGQVREEIRTDLDRLLLAVESEVRNVKRRIGE